MKKDNKVFDIEFGIGEKLESRDSKIKSELDENINTYPKAIYFIIPNELCERFCFFGISALKFKFLMAGYGLSAEKAKVFIHLFIGMNNFTPLIGAAISDSYLGKYKTTVILSVVYLISNTVMMIFSINGLIGEYGSYPIYSFLVPAFFFSLGTGGIKSCISSLGGDQFLPTQSTLRDNFFSIFYFVINIGGLAAFIIAPYIRTYINCFGSPCYLMAFGIPTIAFAISFILFLLGHRYYRVIPPQGEFLLWKSTKLIILAIKRRFKASPNERNARKHWLQFAEPEYNFGFIEETRLIFNLTLLLLPVIFYFSLFIQTYTEWQKQYEKMNKNYFNLFHVPTEASSSINMILVVFLVPFLNYIVYPFMKKKNFHLTLVNRIISGYFLVILSFIVAVILDYYVDQYSESMIIKNNSVISCTGCLNGAWQFPQLFLVSLSDSLISPAGLQLAYSEVGLQLKASSSSIWLLTMALGNFIVMILELPLQIFSSQTRQWIHITISGFWFFVFIALSKKRIVSKEDENYLKTY